MSRLILLRTFYLSWCLFAASLIPVFAGQEETQTQIGAAPFSNGATGAAKSPDQERNFSFKDGLLSARARNLPLARLADELSQKAGIAVLLLEDVGNESVSANFDDLPVDQGLRRVLKKQDAFFFYGVDEDQSSSLKAIWIYPKGRGRGLAPIPPDKWQSTKEISAMLKDSDPNVRSRAIETLVERKGSGAKEAVLTATHDDNEQVRSGALYAALHSAMELPEGDLSNLALKDNSADVRFLALQALSNANSPDLRAIAEQAANDSNEAVRNAAREALSRLNQQSSPAMGRPGASSATQQQNQPEPSP